MNFKKLFDPQTVAVIGASKEKGKVGYSLFYNLAKSGSRQCIPINLNEKRILRKKVYPSVLDVTEDIDLAVIAVPAKAVPAVLKECGEKRIPNVIIISAGFKEMGGDGVGREEEVVAIAEEYGIRVLGPNCLGLIDPYTDLNATFGLDVPEQGSIAFLSQSGALGTSMLDWAQEQHIGFSKFVSLGNESDLNEIDFLEYLRTDTNTTAILLYLEQVSDGERFISVVKELAQEKPVVVLKAGRSEKGGAAVQSHTGSLTPKAEVFEAICKQHGVISVNSLRDFFNLAKLFSVGITQPLSNLALVTNAGGPSVITTDLTEFSDSIGLAELPEKTKSELAAVLPPMASVKNPIDILGDAESDRYTKVIDILMKEEGVDAIVALLTPQMMTKPKEVAEALTRYRGKKPVLAVFIGGNTVTPGIKLLQDSGVVVFEFPQDVVSVLDSLNIHAKQETKGKENAAQSAAALTMMDFDESVALLKGYGVEFYGKSVRSKEELIVYSEHCDGAPLALKVLSKDIVHKSDAQGVQLNVLGSDALSKAWDDIMWFSQEKHPRATIEGVVAQPMVDGHEVIIGMKRDSVFGPIILFGIGGVYVEVYKDVSMRGAPLDETTAREMIQDVRGRAILEGLRGKAPVNTDSLVQVLLAVSRLSIEHPEIQEIDFNPVLVNEKDAYVVDVRIMI